MDGILNQQEAGFWTFLPNKKPPPWRDPWWGVDVTYNNGGWGGIRTHDTLRYT